MEYLCFAVFVGLFALVVKLLIWAALEEYKKTCQMSPEELAKDRKEQAEQHKMTTYGTIKSADDLSSLPNQGFGSHQTRDQEDGD